MAADKLKGMKRSEIQAMSLLRRQAILAFIEKHGPSNTDAIITSLGYPRGVVFGWLSGMVEDGHVTLEQVNIGNGRKSNVYSLGKNREPLAAFKIGGGYQPLKDPKVRQSCVKAKQVGMPAYGDLPMSFFGRQVGA